MPLPFIATTPPSSNAELDVQIAYIWLRVLQSAMPFIGTTLLFLVTSLLLAAADVAVSLQLLFFLLTFGLFVATLSTPYLPICVWALREDYLYAVYNGRGQIIDFVRGEGRRSSARTRPSHVMHELGQVHYYPALFEYPNVSVGGNHPQEYRLFFEKVAIRMYWAFDPTRAEAEQPAYAVRELFDNPNAVEAHLYEPIRNAIREVTDWHTLDSLMSSAHGLDMISESILRKVASLGNGIFIDKRQISVDVLLPSHLRDSYTGVHVARNIRHIYDEGAHVYKNFFATTSEKTMKELLAPSEDALVSTDKKKRKVKSKRVSKTDAKQAQTTNPAIEFPVPTAHSLRQGQVEEKHNSN